MYTTMYYDNFCWVLQIGIYVILGKTPKSPALVSTTYKKTLVKYFLNVCDKSQRLFNQLLVVSDYYIFGGLR